jgi:hypothetical protein
LYRENKNLMEKFNKVLLKYIKKSTKRVIFTDFHQKLYLNLIIFNGFSSKINKNHSLM